MIFGVNYCIYLEILEDFENHALILFDHNIAIFSSRAIEMSFKRPEQHIFSFFAIKFIGIKHFLVDCFGP